VKEEKTKAMNRGIPDYMLEHFPEDDYETEEERLSSFAYEGFAPACLKLGKKGCWWWGGDGLCNLAITLNLVDQSNQGIEKLTEVEQANIEKELEEHGRYCPLQRE